MTIDVKLEKLQREAESKGYAAGAAATASYERRANDAERMLFAVLAAVGKPVRVPMAALLADMPGQVVRYDDVATMEIVLGWAPSEHGGGDAGQTGRKP